MKNKILSLILVLMLIPFASLFSACGKDKGYDLNLLDDEFYQIAQSNNNIELNGGKLVFNYSSHGNLNNIINNSEIYKNINAYNYIFDNLMSFAFEFVDECSNNSATDNVQIKNQVKTELDNFKQKMEDLNVCVNSFAEIINVSQGVDVEAAVCLMRFENLLETYERMFNSAINFNNSLTNLYFNHILKDGNPNVYAIDIANFDANIVVSKINSRIQYQKSLLSQCYIEMYVDGDLAERVADGNESVLLSYNGYYTNVENLKRTFTEEKAADAANNENNKKDFYDLAIKAQNVQATLNNDRDKFVSACNTIEYLKVNISISKTPHELMCIEIINSNNSLIIAYNDILIQMLNIIVVP